MPFLRFSRDRRGYENFFIVQPAKGRGRPPRVLYWFRTPPNVKVGRDAFEPSVQRAIEAQNPDLTFDWDALLATPIPSAEPEPWRERRDAERRAKAARRAEADAPRDLESEAGNASEPVPEEPALSASEASGSAEIPPAPESPESAEAAASGHRRRRRRRGRRGRRPQGGSVAPNEAATALSDVETPEALPESLPESSDDDDDSRE